MTEGPLQKYRALRRAGEIRPDPAQELAAEKLQSLHHALVGYEPATGRAGWKERFGLARRKAEAPLGLYMFGGVGRGKSMLMDLFFEATPLEQKRRVHFHAFMLEVHQRIHDWRQAPESGRKGKEPIRPLAAAVAADAWLLCFDEFQVTNIADAMVLGRLFVALFDLGVVMVATSNVAPDDLYKDGLQRELFLPFIGFLKNRLDVLELDGGVDYRLDRLKTMQVYNTPLGPATNQALDDDFRDLTEGATPGPMTLDVQGGRTLEVSAAARGVARFTFAELCEQPLGAADYLAIANAFHTVILAGIPKMRAEMRNEAKRFVTLIDALYEHRVNLVCGADAAPDDLYPAGETAFEFQRTASRLMEMQDADYISEAHGGAASS